MRKMKKGQVAFAATVATLTALAGPVAGCVERAYATELDRLSEESTITSTSSGTPSEAQVDRDNVLDDSQTAESDNEGTQTKVDSPNSNTPADSVTPDDPSEAATNEGSGSSSAMPSKAPASADGSDEKEPAQDSLSFADGETAEVPSKDSDSVMDSSTADAVPDMIESGTYVIASKKDPHKVLDIASASTSNGGNAQLYDSNGTDAQRWYIEFDRDKNSKTYGYCTIKNLNSGLALDVNAGQAKNGQNVQQYAPNGTKAQWWKLKKVLDAKGGFLGFNIVSALSGNYGLDLQWGGTANGTNLWLYGLNNSSAQLFSFIDAAKVAGSRNDVIKKANEHKDDLADGTYVISSDGSVRRVYDVENGSKGNSANVRVWDYNASGAQRWKVSTVYDVAGNAWRTIKNVNSGLVLDVSGGLARNEANIQQYVSNGTNAQRWVIARNADGSFSLWSALGSNLVADLQWGSTACGANAWLYAANGSKAQKFLFTSTSTTRAEAGKSLVDGLYTPTANGKAWDVPAASTANGKQLQAYGSNGTLAQGFQFAYDSRTGYYHIYNVSSNKSLDLASGDILPGGKIQQWDSGDTNWNQLWSIKGSAAGGWKIFAASNGLGLGFVNGLLTTVSADRAMTWKLSPYVLSMSEGYYTIASAGNGNQVLEIANGSWGEGAHVSSYQSNGTLAQKWYIRKTANGTYTLQNVNSGLYASASGSSITQKNRDASSEWKLGFTHESGLTFTSAQNGGWLSLAKAAANGVQTALSSTASGKLAGWIFSSTGIDMSGFWEVASVLDSNKRLDVSGASKNDGGNVQIWQSNGGLAQRWWIRSAGDGWYTLTPCNSALRLDIANGSAASGANVQQWSGNGSKAQKWRFSMGEKGMQIVSALGTVLDVWGASSKNGTNVDAYKYNGTAAQAWRFVAAAAPSKIGYQNDLRFFQVSSWNVWVPGSGAFGYATPSRISIDATREDCVEAMIGRAMEYLGTPYKWDYSCAPGVGVDCAGLVMQALYATGMDLGYFNPWDHYYTPGHDHYANDMWYSDKFMHVNWNDRQRGDLICWPGHIAIYLGNDQIIEAVSPAVGVRIASVYVWSGSKSIRGVLRPFN